MLAPIRPKPIIPNCTALSFPPVLRLASTRPAERAPDEIAETTKAGRHVRTEMHTEEPPSALGQDLKVALGLKAFEQAEGVFLTGDRQVHGILGGDLKKHSGIGPALMELSGRMEKARAEAQG